MAQQTNKFTGSSKADEDIETIRIPSIGSLLYRGTAAAKDQRFVNGFFDVLKNPQTDKTYYYFNKRWGLTQTGGIRPPAGNGTARGCYSWNGNLYSVYGTSIYSGTTDLGVTLTSSTGLCGFAEVRPGAGTVYYRVQLEIIANRRKYLYPARNRKSHQKTHFCKGQENRRGADDFKS